MPESSQRIAPDTVNNAPVTKVETQFPALQKTEGTFQYTIVIGKQQAWWIVAIGLVVVFMLGMTAPLLYQTQREYRLLQNATDEKRLENRQAWKVLGIDGVALEDHDISDILKHLREKYPLEKDK